MATKKTGERISDKAAERIELKSTELAGPIRELPKLQRSLLLAEVALIAYLQPAECSKAAARLGFTGGNFYECDGSQAYWLSNEEDSVIACRGTEPTEWNDIKADLHAALALAETVGHVHRGFKKEVDDLWPLLEKAIASDRRDLWFTGHSLGGALAYICAGRCLLSHVQNEPREVQTFGSPRVGTKRYVNYTKVPHIRWVNNNDIVARVPPRWLGYSHSGQVMYINYQGEVKELDGWQGVSDKWRGFLQGLWKLRADQLADHLLPRYIDAIHREIKRQESQSL